MNYDALEMNYDALEMNYDALEMNYDALEMNYDALEMNYDALEKLPESGVPDKLAYVEHDDHDETINADFSVRPTDHDGDSVVYDKETEMSSILP